ncbi:hypothetical protein LY76DRAFT_617680 [Colletotrichum caudatum]|nr:hypothetical protein LY76DRAFT_617680 [Colletotrichum caudatum]
MYLREEDVLHPPEGGWPSITSDNVAKLGKTDGERNCQSMKCEQSTGDDLNVPSHVISLTMGNRDSPVFLLDTELGRTVHLHECPGEVKDKPTRENEVDWRIDAARWAVKDLLEMLKDHFTALNFIFPRDSRNFFDAIYYRHHGWANLE